MTTAQADSLPSRLFGALADSTRRIDLDMLKADTLSKAMVVLSPVFGLTFDAVDLAERLQSYGYDGRYIAFAASLPNHGLILDEVSAVAPDLSFDIVETGNGPRQAPALLREV